MRRGTRGGLRWGLVAGAAAAVLLAPSMTPEAGSTTAPTAETVVDCRDARPSCWPSAFAFTPSGRKIFYVERLTGQIRWHHLQTGVDRRWATIGNLATCCEQGLLGIALDPRWASGIKYHRVYAYHTMNEPRDNRIMRLRRSGGEVHRRTLLQIAAAGGYHNGGVLHIGPDGKLYAVTGEAHDPALAQAKLNPAGKVLRMNLNGSRPASNPIAGSLAYSYGHRNSYGFTFDPQTDVLWQTENGPNCEDEINPIDPGANYGWGAQSVCPDTSESGQDPVDPAWEWTPVIAVTGAAFCQGCGITGASGRLLVGSYLTNNIRALTLNAARDDVTAESPFYLNDGGVLAVEAAPDASIHFSDDRGIYRLS